VGADADVRVVVEVELLSEARAPAGWLVLRLDEKGRLLTAHRRADGKETTLGVAATRDLRQAMEAVKAAEAAR